MKTTETFLKFLVNQTHKNFQLILIDDGSVDGTDQMVLSYPPDTIVIKGNGNWWWGGSLHQGYKWIKKFVKNKDDIVL
ncbi:MAG: glycosyltransferase [Brevinematia bacterium]